MGTMLPPYDKIKPLYVDVSFLPGGGNPHLVDVEWFKRVRARFYVVTDPRPSVRLLDAMLYGKEAWTGPDSKLAVSVIFTCESDELMTWLGRNTARLNACHMDVAAIASRSRIQLVKEPLPTIEQTISTQALSCVGYRIDI
ncbi:unnamed protein product [Dicrocoelium dendriticum]|nr:unnamed protein product [Dicrocoelium dendriticum]